MKRMDSGQISLLAKSCFSCFSTRSAVDRFIPETDSFAFFFFSVSSSPLRIEFSSERSILNEGGLSFFVKYFSASLYPFLSIVKSTYSSSLTSQLWSISFSFLPFPSFLAVSKASSSFWTTSL